MNYKQLQAALKTYRDRGMTSIKLNSKLDILQAEYNRLQALEVAAKEANKVSTETEKLEGIKDAIALSANTPVLSVNHKQQSALRSANNTAIVGNVSPRHSAGSTKDLYSKASKAVEAVKTTVKTYVNAYTRSLTDTERQAIRNGIVATKNVRAFISGFNDGLKRSYRD